MMKKILGICTILFLVTACNLGSTPPVPETSTPDTATPVPATFTLGTPLTDTPTLQPPTPSFTPLPTFTATSTSAPVVESLKATTTPDLLSCRYGPGSEYLYLYALRKGSNIELIGRTDANNWVMVAGRNKCWVNAKFLDIEGDKNTLRIMYPGEYKLPVSPYYQPTDWVGAKRTGNTVLVEWNEVAVNIGDYEDENMFVYIIEVWRCDNGQIIFEPLATNDLGVTIIDEPGCAVPSHGRVYVQEKHGYAGPVEITWP